MTRLLLVLGMALIVAMPAAATPADETLRVLPLDADGSDTSRVFKRDDQVKLVLSGTVTETNDSGTYLRRYDPFYCYQGCSSPSVHVQLFAGVKPGPYNSILNLMPGAPKYSATHRYAVSLYSDVVRQDGKLRFYSRFQKAVVDQRFSGSWTVQVVGGKTRACRKPASRSHTGDDFRFQGITVQSGKIVSTTFGRGRFRKPDGCSVLGAVTHRDFDPQSGDQINEVVLDIVDTEKGLRSIQRAGLTYVWEGELKVVDSDDSSCRAGRRGNITVREEGGSQAGSIVLTLCGAAHKHVYPKAAVDLAANRGQPSWAAWWTTDFGLMKLTQRDDKVTGTYTYRGKQGRISGDVTGRTLRGKWSQEPTYNPPRDAGEFEFTLLLNESVFKGKWRYGTSGPWKPWNGSTG